MSCTKGRRDAPARGRHRWPSSSMRDYLIIRVSPATPAHHAGAARRPAPANTMWFSRLKRIISHASGVNRRLRVRAHCTPPNPPPTITTLFSAVLITPAAYSKNRAMTGDGRLLRRFSQENESKPHREDGVAALLTVARIARGRTDCPARSGVAGQASGLRSSEGTIWQTVRWRAVCLCGPAKPDATSDIVVSGFSRTKRSVRLQPDEGHDSTHKRRNAAARPVRFARAGLEALGPLSLRAAVGHRARGLLGPRHASGSTSRTTRRGAAPTGGVKTGCSGSATGRDVCASRWRCGTNVTRSSRSDCSA